MFVSPKTEFISEKSLTTKKTDTYKLANELGIGKYTLDDILENLEKPDRDIRDSIEPIIFKKRTVNVDDITR